MKYESLLEIRWLEKYKISVAGNPESERVLYPQVKTADDRLMLANGGKECGCVYDKNSISILKKIENRAHISLLIEECLYIFVPDKMICFPGNMFIFFEKPKKYIDDIINHGGENYLVIIKDKNLNSYINIGGRNFEIKIEEGRNLIRIVREVSFNPAGTLFVYKVHNDKLFCVETDEELRDLELGMKGICIEDYMKEDDKSRFYELWEKYGNIEKEILDEVKDKTSSIRYSEYGIKNGALRFHLDGDDGIDEDILYYKEFVNCAVMADLGREKVFVGTLKDVSGSYMEVDCMDDSIQNKIKDKNGKLELNFRGSEVSIARRERAYSKIQKDNCYIKGLKKIITGEFDFQPAGHSYSFQDFIKGSTYAEEKQKSAIEGSINTDSVFLIQGPPGTGKTTVIRKLISEILKRDKDSKILVTSYQNTAVDNVVKGMGDFNLSAYRYNGNGDSQDNSTVKEFTNSILKSLKDDMLKDRGEYHTNSIKKAFDDMLQNGKMLMEEYISKLEYIKNLYRSYAGYKDEIVSLMDEKLKAGAGSGETAASGDISRIEGILTKIEDVFDEEVIGLEELLSDIGKKHSDDRLNEILNEFQNIMENIEDYGIDDIKDKAVEFKDRLVVIQDTGTKAYADEEDMEFLISLRDDIYKKIGHEEIDDEYRLLLNWRDELKNNSYKFEEVLKKYAQVSATTCQKSVSYGFYDIKQLNEYDYVIIDEAARANPLDLFIPMSLGNKIIMVGDHYQLPHLIDDSIDKKLKESESITEEEYEKYIKDSLFGSMFNSLPHDRKVMLDVQYRMNKEIGDLVSDLFYEGKLKTGTDITNDTPLFQGKSLVAVNIDGEEIGEVNQAEVRYILKTLKELDEKGKYDVGVITFYKKQAQYLEKRIRELNLVNLKPMVNTVDAFQGMENEIVILSTVNTNRIGFTANPNRLNVAISRAQKLLLIVSRVSNMKKNSLYDTIFKRCYMV